MSKQPSKPMFLSLSSGESRQSGFTMIEILVTLFILAIGLLGLAGLLFEGMRNNQGSYLRTQASILAYDMADRMRANSAEAQGGSYGGFSTATIQSTTLPACTGQTAGCTPSDQVTVDQVEWTLQVQGTGGDMAMLPGGVGTIAHDATSGIYTVTIQWDEASRAGDAGESIAGDNSYAVRFSL
ncbi:type IV pilus modification protein PilV [Marinobacter flavimaris]|uniref:Type IV pilus modification protein PilV n=1 Tax=Marinobacter flavimaris TaxID=262076 RepID=A0A3D8GZZ0_9GAMM|nr:type IV pilus modification protein PilV [Marinobacter flavimaris]PPI78975.1 type IV pilus modification protein PilV [Marinobacter flavimaris]RDU39769.1 type IV pilus modification protein PilV [Marinobacter flavimaris]